MLSVGRRCSSWSVLVVALLLLPACSLLTNLDSLSDADAGVRDGGDAAADGTAPQLDASGDAPSSRKRVFYTSGTYMGIALGGIAGADTKCKTASQARTLNGNFVAWISDSKTNAHDRIVDVGPWYSLDRQTLLFPNKAAFDYTPASGIVQDDTGTPHGALCYWTGTDLGGTKTIFNCGDWGTADGGTQGAYGSFGLIGMTDKRWTNDDDGTFPCYQSPGSYGQKDCHDSYGVLCIEQ